MKLVGFDVGFSKTRRTTGIAVLDEDRLDVRRVGTAAESRTSAIPPGFQAEVITFDGPVLPTGTGARDPRNCEYMFIGAPFSGRCKPGLSHFGSGLALRGATAEACNQMKKFLEPHGQIVEAFPNAFLAVLAADTDFATAPKLRRGKRFDWLYDLVAASGRLKSVLCGEEGLPDQFWERIAIERDHEKRAALVCLLTAALSLKGLAHQAGDAKGGWFWLPPIRRWEKWARDGLTKGPL